MRDQSSARSAVALSAVKRHPYRTGAAILALLMLGYGLGVITRSPAVLGPEDRPEEFTIVAREGVGQLTEHFADIGPFTARPTGLDGWDWGGRDGYNCGFVELVDGGATSSLGDDTVIAKLVFESYDKASAMFPDDSLYLFIDSRGRGADHAVDVCSEIRDGPPFDELIATETERSRSVVPGEPTAPPPHAMGHGIVIEQNEELKGYFELPHESAQNVDIWWFRGDEPGEILMWYLETDTGDYGIIGRLTAFPMAANVTVDDIQLFDEPPPAPAPTITSFTPTSGPEGQSVTVTGTGLTGATNVSFNGLSATFTVDSDTQITATVPGGATTGPVSVTTPGGTATSSGSFTVTSPTITSFSPTSGAPNTQVQINGTLLTGTTSVKFNGVSAQFVVMSDIKIVAKAPAGAGSGPISVSGPNGTGTSTANFTVT